jgi:hypothetical protein
MYSTLINIKQDKGSKTPSQNAWHVFPEFEENVFGKCKSLSTMKNDVVRQQILGPSGNHASLKEVEFNRK